MPRPSLERFIRRNSGIDFSYVSPRHPTRPDTSANETAGRGGSSTRRYSIHLDDETRSPHTPIGYRASNRYNDGGDYGAQYSGAQSRNNGRMFDVPPQAPLPPRPAAFGSSRDVRGTGEPSGRPAKNADRKPAPPPRRAASVTAAPRGGDDGGRVRTDWTRGLPTRQKETVVAENAERGARARRSSDAHKPHTTPIQKSRHPQVSDSAGSKGWASVTPFEGIEGRLAQLFFDVVDLVQRAQDNVAPLPSLSMSTMRYVIARLLDDQDVVEILDQLRYRRDDAKDWREVHDTVIDILADDALFRSRYQDKASLKPVPQPMPQHFRTVDVNMYNRVIHWRKLTFMEEMTSEEHQDYLATCQHNAEFGLQVDDPRQVWRIHDALMELWRLMSWDAITYADFRRGFDAVTADARDILLNETFPEKAGSSHLGRRIFGFDDARSLFKTYYQIVKAERPKYHDPMTESVRRGLNTLAGLFTLARDSFNKKNTRLLQEGNGRPYMISLSSLPAEMQQLRDPSIYYTHLELYDGWAQAKVTN